MPNRAILFIDGSNWYHYVKNCGVVGAGELDYAKISIKLIGPSRQWIGTRYYVGRVNQGEAPTLYADQRRFLSKLCAPDPRITAHLGRLERRRVKSKLAQELKSFLGSLTVRIDPKVFHDLHALATRNAVETVTAEKAVDVSLAVDLVMMAQRSEYDAAYLLSADGDFTPAVEAARALGKKVYAASPGTGAQLAAVVNTFIPLKAAWFADCW